MAIIYKIVSPTGRVYVGKTWNKLRRISDYRYKLNGRTSLVINSIKKYGWDAHVFEVIEEVADEKLLDEREIFWIQELQTYAYEHPKGMNMTKGGEGQRTTWMHDVARRKAQSDKFSGDGNPFRGKSHSDETKKTIGDKASKRNKESGRIVPKWGAEKGRLKVIKAIVCYDAHGKFVREFASLADAATWRNVSHSCISDSCRQKQTNAGGYVFRYKTENYPMRIDVAIKKQHVKRPVICFFGSYMLEYPSSAEASKDLSVPKTTINRAAQYNKAKPIRGGLVFLYSDEYKSIKRAS